MIDFNDLTENEIARIYAAITILILLTATFFISRWQLKKRKGCKHFDYPVVDKNDNEWHGWGVGDNFN